MHLRLTLPLFQFETANANIFSGGFLVRMKGYIRIFDQGSTPGSAILHAISVSSLEQLAEVTHAVGRPIHASRT